VDKFFEEGYCEDDITGQLGLQEAYETTYGVYDHEKGKVAFPFNTLHDTIQTTKHFHLDNGIRRFLMLDVFDRTGIPMDRFFQQPHYVNELIYEALVDRNLLMPKLPKLPTG